MPAKVVKEFKQFETMFRKIVRPARYDKRREAERTLTPTMFKKLESGRLKPEEVARLLGNKKPDGTLFTLADIQKFNELRLKQTKTFNATVKGAPVPQLLAASWGADLQRARKEIKRSTLYRINGDLLHFRTPSGPDSKYDFHQVRVKLEEWQENLAGGQNCMASVKRAATGRISFDCDCGRHQYWFRYMATIGGYAIEPLEFAFPKIRNPGLGGACCKHAIMTLLTLQSPMTHNFLAKEMEKQSKEIGFGGDKSKTRFLNKGELDELDEMGELDVPTKAALEKEWSAFNKARKAYQKVLKDPETGKKKKELKEVEKELTETKAKLGAVEGVAKKEIKLRKKAEAEIATKEAEIAKAHSKVNDLAAKNAALEAEAKTHKERVAQQIAVAQKSLERDIAISKMSTALAVKVYRDGMTRDDAINSYAKEVGLDLKEAAKMAEQINL